MWCLPAAAVGRRQARPPATSSAPAPPGETRASCCAQGCRWAPARWSALEQWGKWECANSMECANRASDAARTSIVSACCCSSTSWRSSTWPMSLRSARCARCCHSAAVLCTLSIRKSSTEHVVRNMSGWTIFQVHLQQFFSNFNTLPIGLMFKFAPSFNSAETLSNVGRFVETHSTHKNRSKKHQQCVKKKTSVLVVVGLFTFGWCFQRIFQ